MEINKAGTSRQRSPAAGGKDYETRLLMTGLRSYLCGEEQAAMGALITRSVEKYLVSIRDSVYKYC